MSKQSIIQQIASKIISLVSNHNSDSSAHQSLFNAKLNVSDAFSGDYEDLDNKPTIPTKTSDLNNDSNFLTSQDITGKEDKSNKVTILSALSTDIQYPSAKIVYSSLSNKEDKSKKVTTLSTDSTNDEYPSAKAVYDAIHAIPSPEFVEITSNKGTASASTMDKFYVEIANNKRDVYYTEESSGSYSWHKLDTDILDDLSIDWSDIQNKPSIPSKTSDLTNDSNFLTSHQDISGKLDKAQGSSKASKNVVTDSSGNITTEAKPTIPTKVSQLTNDSGFLTHNGALPSTATKFADYKDEGYYTCGAGIVGNITDKPFTGNYSCIIENKRYDNHSIMQFVYKMPSTNISEIYYRKWTNSGNWTDWKKIANYDEIPIKTSQLTNDGDGTNVFIKNDDTRLTNARTPTSHTHNKSDINFTAISSGNDLNSFVTNGYYSCGSTTSTSVTNKPAMFPSGGANFVLVVEQFGQQIFQTMEMISSLTENSRLYFRSKTASGWSEWKECYSGQKAYYVATTDNPLDLNDFTKKGVFTFSKDGNANGKLSNSPIFGYALYVENQEYSAGNIIQIAKTITTNKNNNRIFYRVYTGSTWASSGAWTELATKKSKAVTVNYTDGSTETINFLIE